jgi:S-formylglutathione hydrolase
MAYTAHVILDEIRSEYLPNPVPYAVLTPTGDAGPFPLCIVLHGGGGSRQSLVDCSGLFEQWWTDGSLPPMVLASPSAEMSYYIEDPGQGERWDAFIAGAFLSHLRMTYNVRTDRNSMLIAGMSMGGYGALKIAFAHPDRFAAVAAMSPVVEPGTSVHDITARNTLHHFAGGPSRLIGTNRDATVFAANNPANRAIANADEIRKHDLAIYIECGDDDFINVHDGSEYLHRVLWDLDISHEYRLTRGADHVGPTLIPRMREAYLWLGSLFRPVPDDSASDLVRTLRAQIEPVRRQAASSDPTIDRRYGRLR